MIKTITTLTCDRCGRTIKKDEMFRTEGICFTSYVWEGKEKKMDPIEEISEHITRDLCMQCYVAEHQDLSASEKEDDAFTTPEIEQEELQKAELPPIPQQTVVIPAVLEIPPEEPETVDMEGKTYTEYQPDPQPEPKTPEPPPGSQRSRGADPGYGREEAKKTPDGGTKRTNRKDETRGAHGHGSC